MTHKTIGFDRAVVRAICKGFSLFALLLLVTLPATLKAQTAGEGTITGLVKDTTGAAIPNATITATNSATNSATTRTSTGEGAFTIAPLPPGVYSVQVTAKGFKTQKQDNLFVDALGSLTFNPVMTLGEATETVEVTSAPPVLDTSNATLGTVIENEAFTNLPIQTNGLQRDPTSFGTLTPGTQVGGGRLPVIGGTGNYLQQLYLEGIPAETINQQGDNRVVSLNVDVDAVDQFQIVTSTPPVEYAGAGAENFTMKSGSLKPHGQIADFVRNTIFDAWSFTNKWVQTAGINPATGVAYPTCVAGATTATVNGNAVNYAPRAGCQKQPFEHQNELSLDFGWKVPHTGNKLFFFVAYDKYHGRSYSAPVLSTIPTTLMRTGDFTELNGNVGTGGLSGTTGNNAIIFDPTSNSCSGTVCTRNAFQGMKNGIPTNNVIPASYLSPIAQVMQSFLPAPTYTNVITNNYLGTRVAGFDNHLIDYRVDYDLNGNNRLSAVGAIGVQHYLNNFGAPYTPLPYGGGDLASTYPKQFVAEETYTINAHLVNQYKFGFTRYFQDIANSTDGVTKWDATTFGITNLPPGQASTEFPGAAFSTNTAVSPNPTTWTGFGAAIATQLTTPNSYTMVDNLQWLKGNHAMTFGFTYQFLEVNNSSPASFSSTLDFNYNAVTTANYNASSSALSTASGYGYASYLLGAVGGSPSLNLQPVSEIGSRYKPMAPYVEDSWKVNQKLTIDMGLRWDYIPPYHEVKNHFSFLNPTITGLPGQPAGAVGAIQLAGNYGGSGVSCGCKSPVNNYWKNFGPRVGVAYSVNEKTVIRAGIGMVYSFGGGSGGGRTSDGGVVGAGGSTGFNVTATGTPEVTSGAAAGPSFYLNNGAYFTSISKANTAFLGGNALPTVPAFGTATQLLQTGNYLNGVTSTSIQTAAGVNYADPYVSGRAPEFTFFNFGIERGITNNLTIAANYVGSESHHTFENTAAQNARGYWVNQLNPNYLAALGNVLDTTGTKPILTAAATSLNLAKAQAVLASVNVPAFFLAAANANPASTTLTLGQGLSAFPQYSGVNDGWGENVQNFAYNSLQITLQQRTSHGLTFNINYTYSKNIGDDGTFRSGYDIPSAALSGGGQNWKQNRIDRSWATLSQPQSVNAYGVYKLPFGTPGHFGSSSLLTRTIVGGWLLSGTYQYASGLPIAVTWSGGCANAAANSGACMPDIAVPLSTNARLNGSYGTGPGGRVAGNLGLAGGTPVKYIDSTVFKIPTDISSVTGQTTHQYLIGNAPRTRPFNLVGPGSQNLNAAVHRSFRIREGMSLIFEADCLNVWNKVQFTAPGAGWSATAALTSNAFGEVSNIANSPRDWQFAGHFNF